MKRECSSSFTSIQGWIQGGTIGP